MEKPYSEIILSKHPSDELLIEIAKRLISEFGAESIGKFADIDSLFWDFKIDSEIIILHQQTFIGITIFPKELVNATIKANRIVEEIGFMLKNSR